MSYTRRSELTATKAEAAASNVILMKDEMLTIVDTNGRRALRFGNGTAKVKDIPNSVDFAEFELLKTQTETIKDQAQQQAVAAKTNADRAKTEADRAASIDAYTKFDTDVLLGGKADQPYNVLTTPADINDSAGGLIVVDKIEGNTVQKAYISAAINKTQNGTSSNPLPIAPGLIGGKYCVKTHFGLYECDLPNGYAIGELKDTLVVDPVSETAKFISFFAIANPIVDLITVSANNSNAEKSDCFFIIGGKIIASVYGSKPINSHGIVSRVLPESNRFSLYITFPNSVTGADPNDTSVPHRQGKVNAYLRSQFQNGTPFEILYQLRSEIITNIILKKVSSSLEKLLDAEFIDFAPTVNVPVTPESVEKIKIVSFGKNIFDTKNSEKYSGHSSVSNRTKNEITLSHQSNATYISANFQILNLKEGGNVTIRGYWENLNGAVGQIRIQWVSKNSAAHGTPVICATSGVAVSSTVPKKPKSNFDLKLCLSLYSNSNGVVSSGSPTVNYKNIQLEIGSIATEYSPYNGWENEIKSLRPLMKNDKIEIIDNRYVQIQKTKKSNITGNENWILWNDAGAEYISFFWPSGNAYNGKKAEICSHFDVSDYGGHGIGINAENGNVSINLKKSELETPDVSGLKKVLLKQASQNTPILLLYTDGTTESVEINNEDQKILKTISVAPKISYIFFDSLVEPTMTAKYRLNLTTWVQNVTQAKEQSITATYLSMVSQEQHATGSEINNIDTQQAITEILIGGK